MRLTREDKAVSGPAPAAWTKCKRYHREYIGESCPECGMAIPRGGGGVYSREEYERYFGGEPTYIFNRLSTDPAPVDLACPPTAEDAAADARAAAAEAAVVVARTTLLAAGRALEHAQHRRSWLTGDPDHGAQERAEYAVAAAREALDEADEGARKALVQRSRQQQVRSERLKSWLNAHRDQW